ncbi:hypothetical protein HID58_088089 [Brassica napus]|uniref:BnaC09g53420D protein n=3 Tax=Brassica TaxID=3705 RepID=A0A078IRY1_BRANA|nr:PREDICTED: uncharacterized protein LOC106316311 isoform X2 [Brassica oleracea var. oleracea]KAH0859828.1 hypothetical protein HID58_088089 [Brassica napus]CAF1765962.1 unnamed protein product [Brassica napus]CDY52742.1 BnaC09g53420D [Brassica napus]
MAKVLKAKSLTVLLSISKSRDHAEHEMERVRYPLSIDMERLYAKLGRGKTEDGGEEEGEEEEEEEEDYYADYEWDHLSV